MGPLGSCSSGGPLGSSSSMEPLDSFSSMGPLGWLNPWPQNISHPVQVHH